VRPKGLKGKGKGHPITGHQGPRGGVEVKLYSFLTSALEGVGNQHHAPVALTPVKNRYPLYRRLGGPQGRSGRVRKISPPPEFDPRTVQPVVSRHTDWATRPTAGRIMSMKNFKDIIGNRTRDLPVCSAVPQPTASPCASNIKQLFPVIHKRRVRISQFHGYFSADCRLEEWSNWKVLEWLGSQRITIKRS
jgi:transposase